MVLDVPEVTQPIDAMVTKALTDNGFVPGNVTVGKKDAFATLLVQLQLTDDTQVQKITELLTKTLIEQKVIASTDNVLEQSII